MNPMATPTGSRKLPPEAANLAFDLRIALVLFHFVANFLFGHAQLFVELALLTEYVYSAEQEEHHRALPEQARNRRTDECRSRVNRRERHGDYAR